LTGKDWENALRGALFAADAGMTKSKLPQQSNSVLHFFPSVHLGVRISTVAVQRKSPPQSTSAAQRSAGLGFSPKP
jgi:hypothetical protein